MPGISSTSQLLARSNEPAGLLLLDLYSLRNSAMLTHSTPLLLPSKAMYIMQSDTYKSCRGHLPAFQPSWHLSSRENSHADISWPASLTMTPSSGKRSIEYRGPEKVVLILYFFEMIEQALDIYRISKYISINAIPVSFEVDSSPLTSIREFRP